jgi:epoxyqueuosine reductase
LTQKLVFYFIAELIIDLDLDYDYAATDHCGTYHRCLSHASIVSPYVVDGSKFLYFTIELKENIPQEMKGKFEDLVVTFVKTFVLE